MEIDLKQNFGRIIRSLEGKGYKLTRIAREMGYTTTTQLHKSLEGDSLLSTKAIINLIENMDVNPYFLFLGEGEMFLTEEKSEIERLREENAKYIKMHNEILKENLHLKEMLEKAQERYNKLIDITSIALENSKKRNPDQEED